MPASMSVAAQEKEHGLDVDRILPGLRGVQQYIEGKLKGRDGSMPGFALSKDEAVQPHPVVCLVRRGLVVNEKRHAVPFFHEVQASAE